MEQKDLENRFTYHAPKSEQIDKYLKVRQMQLDFAIAINELCPESREKSLAITHLEEVGYWTNAGIARNS